MHGLDALPIAKAVSLPGLVQSVAWLTPIYSELKHLQAIQWPLLTVSFVDDWESSHGDHCSLSHIASMTAVTSLTLQRLGASGIPFLGARRQCTHVRLAGIASGLEPLKVLKEPRLKGRLVGPSGN